MKPFSLTSDIASLRGENTLALEVPGGLSQKEDLLRWYVNALRIPTYFGGNWDAFEECLLDLSWLEERRLVLYHRDVPIEASPPDQRTYLEILANAAIDWKPGQAHEVVAAFDPSCEPNLLAALREG